jgi:hypothetical protein
MSEVQDLEQKLKTLREEKIESLRGRDEALRSSQITLSTIDEYIHTKCLLAGYGLSIDNQVEIQKLIKVLHN